MKGLIISIVLVAFLGAGVAYNYATVRDLSAVEILGNERIRVGERNKFIVYTANHGTLENTSSLLHWKFRGADMQAQFQYGVVCDLTVYGWRSGFLSMFPNIIAAECKS